MHMYNVVLSKCMSSKYKTVFVMCANCVLLDSASLNLWCYISIVSVAGPLYDRKCMGRLFVLVLAQELNALETTSNI